MNALSQPPAYVWVVGGIMTAIIIVLIVVLVNALNFFGALGRGLIGSLLGDREHPKGR